MFQPRLDRLARHALGAASALVAATGCFVSAANHSSGGQTASASAVAGSDPTFYANVLPILQANCVECHSAAGRDVGGMTAPMSLTTYEETRRWAPMIAQVVREGRMPPWDAAPEFRGVFRGERWLEDHEKATLIAWAQAGAPAGSPADAPASAGESTAEAPGHVHAHEGLNWSIGKPDLLFGLDRPFLVGDDVDDLQTTLRVQISAEAHPAPRWIKRAQLIPGSESVHHILAWPIAAIAHGVPPVDYPDGYGVLLPAGPQNISFQMHWNKRPGPGTAFEDRSSGGVVFYENGAVIRHVVQKEPLGMFDFVIPAGASNYSASRDFVFDEDSYILAFLPHMHLRGKAAKFELTLPDGTHRVLLHVPTYRFDWQHQYSFKEPVFAPKGSRVTLTLWWDNSKDNPHNPDPETDVYWGTPTWAEMGYGFMDFTRAEPIHHVVGTPIPDNLPQLIVSPLQPSLQDLPPEAQRRLRQQSGG